MSTFLLFFAHSNLLIDEDKTLIYKSYWGFYPGIEVDIGDPPQRLEVELHFSLSEILGKKCYESYTKESFIFIWYNRLSGELFAFFAFCFLITRKK